MRAIKAYTCVCVTFLIHESLTTCVLRVKAMFDCASKRAFTCGHGHNAHVVKVIKVRSPITMRLPLPVLPSYNRNNSLFTRIGAQRKSPRATMQEECMSSKDNQTSAYSAKNGNKQDLPSVDSEVSDTGSCTKWTKELDERLRAAAAWYGNSWHEIARQVGMTGKQCRARWHNQIRPDINHDPWTTEEDEILVWAHAKHGNRWSEIAKHLPGRAENNIKNRWNAAKHKMIRRCARRHELVLRSMISSGKSTGNSSNKYEEAKSCSPVSGGSDTNVTHARSNYRSEEEKYLAAESIDNSPGTSWHVSNRGIDRENEGLLRLVTSDSASSACRQGSWPSVQHVVGQAPKQPPKPPASMVDIPPEWSGAQRRVLERGHASNVTSSGLASKFSTDHPRPEVHYRRGKEENVNDVPVKQSPSSVWSTMCNSPGSQTFVSQNWCNNMAREADGSHLHPQRLPVGDRGDDLYTSEENFETAHSKKTMDFEKVKSSGVAFGMSYEQTNYAGKFHHSIAEKHEKLPPDLASTFNQAASAPLSPPLVSSSAVEYPGASSGKEVGQGREQVSQNFQVWRHASCTTGDKRAHPPEGFEVPWRHPKKRHKWMAKLQQTDVKTEDAKLSARDRTIPARDKAFNNSTRGLRLLRAVLASAEDAARGNNAEAVLCNNRIRLDSIKS